MVQESSKENRRNHHDQPGWFSCLFFYERWLPLHRLLLLCHTYIPTVHLTPNVRQPRLFCAAQVILKMGGDLSALTGLLGCSVAAVRLLTEQEGRGVCLTLREKGE